MTTTLSAPEISRNAALPEPLRHLVNGISPSVPAMERPEPTPAQSFVARLRHAADVLERLGIEPISLDVDCPAVGKESRAHLRMEDFRAAFVGRKIKTSNNGIQIDYSVVEDGVIFSAGERAKVTTQEITLAEVDRGE